MTAFVVPTSLVNWEFNVDPSSPPGVAAVQYAFGIRTDVRSLWFHSGVGPTDWIKIGDAAGGGGSSLQIFEYVVTGSEPDTSEITITLPTAMPSSSYGVAAQCQGVTSLVALDVPSATRTTTHFVVIATDDMVAGDRILFMVGALTA